MSNLGATRKTFISPAFLKANSPIDANCSDKVLSTCIRTAMDKYIKSTLGRNLYDAYLNKVVNGSITGDTANNDYKYLMDNFIVPALIHYSVLEFIPYTSFKMKNKGIVQQNAESIVPATQENLEYQRDNIVYTAQYYDAELRNYIQANTNIYTEYNTVQSDQTPPAGSTYFSGIHIPGRKSNYNDGFNNNYTPLN